jgi:hypothetical protein
VQKVHSTRIFLIFIKELFSVFCCGLRAALRLTHTVNVWSMAMPCHGNVTLQKSLCGGAKKRGTACA